MSNKRFNSCDNNQQMQDIISALALPERLKSWSMSRYRLNQWLWWSHVTDSSVFLFTVKFLRSIFDANIGIIANWHDDTKPWGCIEENWLT